MPIPGNVLFALSSAASWGGGDFCGGMGVKAAHNTTTGALRLVIVAHAVSLTVLTAILWMQGAPRPHGAAMVWALGAGVGAAISLTAFYMALARGVMGASAAISGVLAAAIPAAVSTVLEGAPAALRIGGFLLAIIAIWMIAAGPAPKNSAGEKTLGLAIVGGVGFGFYFVALRMANGLGVMEPMAIARAASLISCLLLLGLVALRNRAESQQRPWLSASAIRWALGVALLDTGGNLLFIAASRSGRLDVAAVLASLYPAVTILLAAWRLHERPTRRQILGMGVAAAAVVMITL